MRRAVAALGEDPHSASRAVQEGCPMLQPNARAAGGEWQRTEPAEERQPPQVFGVHQRATIGPECLIQGNHQKGVPKPDVICREDHRRVTSCFLRPAKSRNTQSVQLPGKGTCYIAAGQIQKPGNPPWHTAHPAIRLARSV